MENNIKTFTIFCKDYDETGQSKQIADMVCEINRNIGCPLTQTDDGDLIIAIGGDGTFLRAVNQTKFAKDKIYAGVNTGTLGFLQDLSTADLFTLMKYISTEKNIRTKKIKIPIVTVNYKNNRGEKLKFFNEVLIAGKDYQKISFSQFVMGDYFQTVNGNGIIISSSAGDTAYALNAGGAIDFSNDSHIVSVLISPIKNASYPDFISNPVICTNTEILIEEARSLQIIIDGRTIPLDTEGIKSITVEISAESYINKIQLFSISKVTVVSEKILGNKTRRFKYGNTL